MEALQATRELYEELQQAYDFFNRELFAGMLPGCLLTLQRKKRTLGYFSRERFVSQDGEKTDEIAMNPSFFAIRSLQDSMSTLVHEMVHQYQALVGLPSRKRYHNEEFARMMARVGLIASDTGQPGGRQTGDRVSHYIEAGGIFEQACARLPEGFRLSWMDRYPPANHLLFLVNQAREEDDEREDEEDEVPAGGDPTPSTEEVQSRRVRDEDDAVLRIDLDETGEEADDESAWRLVETFGLDDPDSLWDGMADGASIDGGLATGPEEETAGPNPAEKRKEGPESAQTKLKRLLSLGVVVNPAPASKNLSNRVKYSCPSCEVNVWGKPRLNLVCGDCGEAFGASS